jgi:3-oxoacyl-[acyl-carrier protein] reductase
MQDKVLVEISALRGLTPAELHEQRLQSVVLRNKGCEPDAIADGIVFLLSSAARYVTGQALGVDGGLVMY